MKKSLVFLFLPILFCTCADKLDPINFANPEIQQIIIAQDKRDTPQLLPFLTSSRSEIRERAALAFASVQDPTALPFLEKLLNEESSVAQVAAFAIGQLRSSESIPTLQKAFANSSLDSVRYEILVAMGKSGGDKLNQFLSTVYSTHTDDVGVAWSLCYLSLQGHLDTEGAKLAYSIARDQSNPRARFGAAFALSRYSETDVTIVLDILYNEPEDEVKAILYTALANISADVISDHFLDFLESSSEGSQINFLKIAPKSESLLNFALRILKGEQDVNLKLQAATYLSSFPGRTLEFLSSLDIEDINWRIRSTLLSQLNDPGPEDLAAIRDLYENSSNEYEKGMLLQILNRHKMDKEWIKSEINKSSTIVSTYGMESLTTQVNAQKIQLRSEDLPFLINCLWTDQDALIYYASVLLRDSIFFTREVVDTLTARQSQLTEPGKIEAYFAIENTFRYFSKTEPLPYTAKFNNPIDPEELKSLDRVRGFYLKTTKGEIVLEAKPWEAPGTVLSMVRLAKEGFYNGKSFHRTVPNFLVQTGSTEGDGWGIANLSRRSEFSRLEFKRGAVGVASLGKDTESSQWTIYHAQLPRDNGYYTVFAEVIEGMEIVEQIEMGDRILEMTTLYN